MKSDSSQLGEKIPEFLKKAETYHPNIPLAISYCKLHQTTSLEEYRKSAIESLVSAKGTIDAYNMFVPSFKEIRKIANVLIEGDLLSSLNVSEATMKRAVKKLTELQPVDTTPLKEFENYCTGCAKPNVKCNAQRKKLEQFDGGLNTGITDYISKVFKTTAQLLK